MAWRGSLSRTLMSTVRASSFRSSPPPLPRLHPPTSSAPRLQSRRISFTNPRNLGELGCAQSLLPLLAGARLTSHLTVSVRACCELSHGGRKSVIKALEKGYGSAQFSDWKVFNMRTSNTS